MLIVERQFSSHAPTPADGGGRVIEFDVELGDLERTEGIAQDGRPRLPEHGSGDLEPQRRAYPLTFGLAVHAFVDGIAMGSAAFSASGDNDENSGPSRLFVAVFLALVVHKGKRISVSYRACAVSLKSGVSSPDCARSHDISSRRLSPRRRVQATSGYL